MIFDIVAVTIIVFISYTTIKASLSFAPWVPTFERDVDRAFALAKLVPNEIFLDLGCGNGRMPIEAARRCGARGQGVELVFPLYLVCLVRKLLNRNLKLQFSFTNLFKTDVSQADVIYIFGLPRKLSGRLSKKLLAETKRGARLVSYCFPLADFALIKEDRPTPKDLPIYLYTKI